MKASLKWLQSLVPGLPKDPREIASRFTSAGLEIESMQTFGDGAEKCVVARVTGVRAHPTKSGLRLVMVDRGGAQQEVVCGAPNVPEPGGLVVLAPLGTHLPAKGMTIEKRTIAGVTSEGMLCSEQELGIGDDTDGIIVLPETFADPGALFTAIEPAAHDTIFEIGLTPNRPDGLGHIGLARELAALFELPFAWPAIADAKKSDTKVESLIDVRIEDAERCAHYGTHAVLDVTVGPSPLWMRYRLAALGVRSISNAVDVTNYVMLEYGHPLHAFDLDKVRGAKIVVRRAKEGEALRTLDGVDRTLVADDLVIGDGEGATGLGGVMGGGDSEVSAATKRILLECAYFDPRGVRRTSRRHALHTEASHRFERGVDHGDTLRVLARAAQLTAQLGGGSIAPAPKLFEARAIPKTTTTLRNARLGQLLGAPVPREEATAILKRLGFVPLPDGRGSETAGADTFEVPSHRPDVSREVDLIEEVARVRGLDRIPTVLPAIRPTIEGATRESTWRRAREAAVAIGLSEALTYGFVSKRELDAVGAPEPKIVLKNPLNENQSVMRTSLLPGLLESVARARRHGERDVRIFTVGAIFLGGGGEKELPDERMSFAAVLAGERPARLAKPEAVDVFDAKGVAIGVIERLARRDASFTPFGADRPKHLHPRAAASIEVGGKALGRIGLLHPDVADALDVGGEVALVEIDLDALESLGRATQKYATIPRFPASTRDVALVVHDDVPAGDVERAVREAAGAMAAEVSLFDRFAGGAVPADHTSLAFHVVYRVADRTLTDAEVDAQHAKVVAEVGKRFGATLRA